MNFRHSRSGRVQLGLPGLLSIVLLGLLLLPMMAAKPETTRGGAPSASFVAIEAAPLADLVDRTSQSIYDAFNRRDRAAFLAAFAPEPIIAPDQSGLLTGRSGVTDMYLRSPAGMSYVGAEWSERTLYELENWVIELGTLGFKYRLHPDAPVMTEPRAALSIWEKTADGELRVKLLTWNRLSDASGLAQKSAATAYEGRPAAGSQAAPDDFAEVLALEERFHRAFEIQDLDTAIAFYAEGAALLSPRARPLHGRDAIAEYLHGRRPGQLAQRIEREVAHIEGGRDHVLVVNLFRWTFIPLETDVPVTVIGKGTHLWERGSDGAWHLLFDLPNASQPTG